MIYSRDLTVATVRDAAGNPLAVGSTLRHPDGTTDRETSSCSFDNLGRPVRRISSRGAASETLVNIDYDAYSRPYCTDGAAGTFNYLYDVNSRLTGNINQAFGEHLTYTPAGLIAGRRTYLNGRESEIRQYEYDGAARLTDVALLKPNPSSSADIIPETSYTYDRNSNTTTIRRRGRIDDELIGTAGTPVYGVTDDMTLTYDGNRLVSVSDSGTGGTRSDSYDFHDGADESVEYTYDEAGRLTSDLNRGITSIVWNAASQPLLILLDNGDRMEYTYSATGERLAERQCRIGNGAAASPLSASALSATVPAGGSLRTPPMPSVHTIASRRFVGPFELEGDSVTRVNVAGGYWNADGLHGYIADWQGNVRAVRRAKDGTLVQLTDYYPYGTPSYSTNPTANPYKYSGKEFETRYALNLSHHGARLMLNDLIRFASPDPLASLTPGISPYTYCHSDPINFIDQFGLYEKEQDAINAAKKRFPGQKIIVEFGPECGEFFIKLNATQTGFYDGIGDPVKDFGKGLLFRKPGYVANVIATTYGIPNNVVKCLLEEAGEAGWLMNTVKNTGNLTTLTNAIFLTLNPPKGNSSIGQKIKYVTDWAVTLAPVIVDYGVKYGMLPLKANTYTAAFSLVYLLVDGIVNGY